MHDFIFSQTCTCTCKHKTIKHMHYTRRVIKSLCFLSNIMQKSFVFYLIPHIWSELSSQLASSPLVISFHLCIFFSPTVAEVQCIWPMGYVMLLLLKHYKRGMNNIFIFIMCFTAYLFTYGTSKGQSLGYVHSWFTYAYILYTSKTLFCAFQ